MRSKEEAHDYRYFPEPDLQYEIITENEIDSVRKEVPRLPAERFRTYTAEYGLSEYDAYNLTEIKEISDYFERVVAGTKNYKAAANWVMGPVKSFLNERALDIKAFPVSAGSIAGIVNLIDKGRVSHTAAVQKLFPAILENPGTEPETLALGLDIVTLGDEAALLSFAKEVLRKHPDEVIRYREGDKKLIGFFMGELMKLSRGKVEPKSANAALKQELENELKQ